jgi:hypothetical protein
MAAGVEAGFITEPTTDDIPGDFMACIKNHNAMRSTINLPKENITPRTNRIDDIFNFCISRYVGVRSANVSISVNVNEPIDGLSVRLINYCFFFFNAFTFRIGYIN